MFTKPRKLCEWQGRTELRRWAPLSTNVHESRHREMRQNIDLVLLGNCHSQNLFDVMARLKTPRPHLPIIVTGSGMDEQTILKAIASGAKGYVDAAASPADFVQAIRIVSQGSVWAPRRILSMFIERV